MLTSFTHGSLICPSGLPRNHPISPLQDSPALTLLLTHPHTTWAPWIISAMTLMTRSLKDFIYLFLDRGEGREKERERNISVWLPLGPPPRHVPWLGIEPETLWFAGWFSVHWATTARGSFLLFLKNLLFINVSKGGRSKFMKQQMWPGHQWGLENYFPTCTLCFY